MNINRRQFLKASAILAVFPKVFLDSLNEIQKESLAKYIHVQTDGIVKISGKNFHSGDIIGISETGEIRPAKSDKDQILGIAIDYDKIQITGLVMANVNLA